jgi:hypothetical protein
MPALGMLFGWLLLGEQIAWFDLIGLAPVALGIYLVTRPGRSARRKLAPGSEAVRLLQMGCHRPVERRVDWRF